MNQIDKNTVSSIDQVPDHMQFENKGGKGKRILFLGNSITRHAVKKEIGWFHDWGMAASAKEKDYVHLVISKIQKDDPDAVFCICQGSVWECAYAKGSTVHEKFEAARAFDADIIIMRLIENCPRENFDKGLFKKEYLKLIQYLNPKGKAKAILTSSFWKREGDEQIAEVAAENDMKFIYLGDLGERAEMRADGLFEHSGVAAHPGDLGMQKIAELILEKLEELKNGVISEKSGKLI